MKPSAPTEEPCTSPKPYGCDPESGRLVVRGRLTDPISGMTGKVMNIKMGTFSLGYTVTIFGLVASEGPLDVAVEVKGSPYIPSGLRVLTLTKDHGTVANGKGYLNKISEAEAKIYFTHGNSLEFPLGKEWYIFAIWILSPVTPDTLNQERGDAFVVYVVDELKNISCRIQTQDTNVSSDTEDPRETSQSD